MPSAACCSPRGSSPSGSAERPPLPARRFPPAGAPPVPVVPWPGPGGDGCVRCSGDHLLTRMAGWVDRWERWLSGRKRTTRNRLKGNLPWVRIPPSPFQGPKRSKTFREPLQAKRSDRFARPRRTRHIRLLPPPRTVWVQQSQTELIIPSHPTLAARALVPKSVLTLHIMRRDKAIQALRLDPWPSGPKRA